MSGFRKLSAFLRVLEGDEQGIDYRGARVAVAGPVRKLPQ